VVKHPEWDVAVAAHRGQVAWYPENTVAACQGSIAAGFSAIEVDLRRSSAL
jgi:glycerophosphoryl diester phosphodiesterase